MHLTDVPCSCDLRSGGGKSSFFHVLSGRAKAVGLGVVTGRVDCESHSGFSESPIRIHLVEQNAGLILSAALTVKETLLHYARLHAPVHSQDVR